MAQGHPPTPEPPRPREVSTLEAFLRETSRTNRYDEARLAGAERAGLEYAAEVAKMAASRLARADALLRTASGSDPAQRESAKAEAIKSIGEALDELGELLISMTGRRRP